jgi:uncharacterized repeat protein (TIGR03803 family)
VIAIEAYSGQVLDWRSFIGPFASKWRQAIRFTSFLNAVAMQSYIAKRTSALLGRGFAALWAFWAALIVAAGGAALAAPIKTVLFSFNYSDGAFPFAGLLADSKGNLYGTTRNGGVSGYGTVFELTPPATAGGAWTETVLHFFTGGSDGGTPVAGLIAGSKGNLYGTTVNGGASDGGTVFELTPPAIAGGAWTETVLHSFGPNIPSDGFLPYAGLLADSKGNLYGTTLYGGTSGAGYGIGGTVFEVAAAGGETVLHSFSGLPGDGANPYAGLLADSKGNLYGTTQTRVVFELSPPATAGGAWTETVLYALNSPSYAGLIADSKGNLYGTTIGNVFELTPPPSAGAAWAETVLHSFSGYPSDGFECFASLIADSKGNLYGTTQSGGASDAGTVFKLTPPATAGAAWTETVLYSFTGGSDGGAPYAGLIADSKGNLYGTTQYGGTANVGTVFELKGTGFATPIPFTAFRGKLNFQFGKKPNTDAFELLSEITLGTASNGINPPAERVTLTVGTFTMTIPPGSFQGTGYGPFHFVGTIDGVLLQVGFVPTGAKRYAFTAVAENASLTGTTNPVTVTLTIGDDTGTTSIKARID